MNKKLISMDDYKKLIDFAINNRVSINNGIDQDVLEINDSVAVRTEIFKQGVQLSKMKTIANLMNRLDMVEQTLSDNVQYASMSDLVKIHQQLLNSLKLQMENTFEQNTLTIKQNNFINNSSDKKSSLKPELEDILKDKQKRTRLLNTFEGFIQNIDLEDE